MIRVAIFGFILASCEIVFIYSLNKYTSKATFALFSGEEHGSVTSLFHKSFHQCSVDENCNFVARSTETNTYKKYSVEASLPKDRENFVIFKKKTDIDECKSTPCQNNGTCVDEANQYTCSCLPGYTGKNRETDIDECESSPCQNGGNCSQSVNSYTCSCMPGYNGTNCELDIDECLARPCLNGGACNNLINSYSCTCLYGFSGNTCEIEINPCLSYPCKNGGTCNNLVTHFSCTCQGQYGGLLCHPYCNRWLNALSGEIVSKNYPSNYPSYTDCYWVIQAASGYRIKVVFHDFLLERRYAPSCDTDYVQLFNGKMSSAPRIGDKLCNSDSPGTKISSGNVMRIEFKTDGSTNYRGFNLTWSTLT